MNSEYVIVRTSSAGVFYARIKERPTRKEAVLVNARRLWHWDGAFTLSALAVEGTTKPGACKFAMPVSEITVTEVIEIIATTAQARASIEGVPTWSPK